ncbi:hypothetical protein [Streptomyces luteireticuli]|uniref:hypothetical protein n=1 Tax=Streptomyces luteireticuli TaxID=173858 RepID=UPI003558EA7A
MTETATTKPSPRKANPTTAVLADVKIERKALGDEPRPLGGGLRPERARLHYNREADRWAEIATARALIDRAGWDAELLATLNRAIGAADPTVARAGLIEVAALAVAAAEQIDQAAP